MLHDVFDDVTEAGGVGEGRQLEVDERLGPRRSQQRLQLPQPRSALTWDKTMMLFYLLPRRRKLLAYSNSEVTN